MSYLRLPDPWRDAVLTIWSDRQAGVCPGWPDGFAAWVVDGVRYLEAERSEAMAADGERRMRELRDRGDHRA